MPPAGEEKDPDRRDLKPLLDYLAYGDAKVGTPRTRTWEAISTTG